MPDDIAPYPAEPTDELATTTPSESLLAPPDVQLAAQATRALQAGTVDASLSAIASAHAGTLTATGSAVGLATVEGDAELSTSAAAVVAARQSASVKQSYVQGFVGADRVDLQQAASAAVLARTVTFDRSGSLVTMSADTEVRGGFVGVLLSGRSNLSDGARVMLTGKALAILALALLGGLGLVALAVWWGAREIAAKMPKARLPHFRRSRPGS